MTLSTLLTVIIFFFFTGVVAVYLFMTRKFGYWTSKGVREMKPTPFFGNVSECALLRKSAGENLKDIYFKGNGLRYIGFYVLDTPSLLIRDTELIKNILIKDFDYFRNRHAATSKKDILGAANLFLLRTPHWKIVREKLTPVYTSGNMKNMFELMIAVGKDLDDHLESLGLGGDGKIVDLKDLCGKFIADVLGTCAFGVRANSFNNPNAEFRKSGQDMFSSTLQRAIDFRAIFFAPATVGPLGLTFFPKTSEKILRHAVWDIMMARMKSGLRRNDLIDNLIDIKKQREQNESQDPGAFVLDDDNLLAQAAFFFVAGFETSSTTITFAMYELALNPPLQTRLRSEILSALDENDGEFTYDMVMQLPYLDMVISETLRKYPSVPALDREASRDYKVPGTDLTIEKGTPTYVSVSGLHYDPKYFPDPENFDPERFNEKNKRHRPTGVYLPFGDGPRHCIGMRFGLLQSKFGLAKIILNHEFTVCSETMIPLRLNARTILTTPNRSLYLNLRNIQQGDSLTATERKIV